MNYGRENVKKTVEKEHNKGTRAAKKFGLTFAGTVMLLVLVLMVGAVFFVGRYVKNLIDECPDVSTIDISPEGFSTNIYDKNGTEIQSLASSGANREYVELEEIPIDLQHAFVAIEDERFYEHNGIDLKGIMRAAFVGLSNGGDFSQGASTITQQLLKNNYFTGWTDETKRDRLERKIQEQYLAVQLEKKTGKDDILENYLNTINLGQNTLGVEAASERYFNKRVSDLTLSECACIAAITQNPSKYNPINHPDYNDERRRKVLKNMLDQGYIKDRADYDEAVSDDVYSRIAIVNNELVDSTTSYFVDALMDQVIDDLMEQKGYDESQAYRLLYSGGLTIKATQDPGVQRIVDEEVNNLDNYPMDPEVSFSFRLTIQKADGTYSNYSEQTMLAYYQSQNSNYSINFNNEEEARAAYEAYKAEIMAPGDTIPEAGESFTFTVQPQVAMTVIDQSTGYVAALTGGRGDKRASRTLNRATDITRQPGSTFKILAAYAPALDAGGMTLASVQDDCPTSYTNGTPLHNYDNSYRGFTNIRTGIIHSINVVAVKTLTQIGTGLGYEYVKDFGITTLESGDNNQALALGGITNGVKNIELCGAYATIANGGVYNRPVLYTEVIARDGTVLLDNTTGTKKEVIKPETAWLLTDAMKDVMTQGTGVAANISNMPVAGKSGTTTKDRDTVFAGFSPYYTTVIWGGYDDNTPQSVTRYSKNIWKAVMSRLHGGLEYKDFPKPGGIYEATVCKKSGKLPIEGVCSNDPRGSQLYTEFFAEGTVPRDTCDHHTSVPTCTVSGLPAGPSCPPELVTQQVFIIGASPGSADSPYLMNSSRLTETCNAHGPGATAQPDMPEPVPPPVEPGHTEPFEGTGDVQEP